MISDFIPGSQWHYVKVYCGVKTADKILCELVLPLAKKLHEEKIIHKWFFIRYNDPDHHLRIRFRGDGNFYEKVTKHLNSALDPYLIKNLVWRIQTDTYKREIERYGEMNIENSEEIFFHDSIVCAEILSVLDGDNGDNLRWLFAFKGADDFLSAFGYSTLKKREIMERIAGDFLKEFNMDNPHSKRLLSNEYNTRKKDVEEVLRPESKFWNSYENVLFLFQVRRARIEKCARAIEAMYEDDNLNIPKGDLVRSYLHMFANRFFRSKQRMQEMVLYDWLHQYYRSVQARTKK